MLPLPAHARQVVLELRELDLELPLGADGVLGEDVEDQLRPVDDARLERVLEVALLRRLELVVDDQRLRAELARTPPSAPRSFPCRRTCAWQGARGAGRPTPTGSTPAARASSSISASSVGVVGAGRENRQHEPTLELRGRRRRCVTRNDYRRADLTRGALASNARAREHRLAEPRRGRDRRARARAHAGRAGVRRTTPSSSTPGRVVLAGHYDTVPAQDNFPGRDRGRLGRRPRRDRHEGRRRGDDRARARGRAVRLPLLRRARSCPPARARCRASSSSTASTPTSSYARADGQHDPGRLSRQPQRAARLPRDERALREAVARRQRDHARRRRARAARAARAARRRDPGARLPRGAERDADRGRHRDERHPGARRARRSTSATRRTARRRRPRRVCASSSTARASWSCSATRRRAASPLRRRSCRRCATRATSRSSRSRRGRRWRSSPRRGSTPSTSGRARRAYAHTQDERVEIAALRRTYDALRASRLRSPRDAVPGARGAADVSVRAARRGEGGGARARRSS